MRQIFGRVLLTCLGLSIAVTALPGAEKVDVAGTTFIVPSPWKAHGDSWILETAPGSRLTLVAASVPGPVLSGEVLPRHPQAAVAAALKRRGFEAVTIEDVDGGPIDGVPAARLRAGVLQDERRLEVFLGVISARDTLVLSLTAEAGNSELAATQFDEILASLRVHERPSLLDRSPASCCGAFLGILAGVTCAAERRRRRRAPC